MENLLLIMPFFRGYEQCLKNALERKYYNVTLINCDQFNQETVDRYLAIRKQMKLIRAFSPIRPTIDVLNRRMACATNTEAILPQISQKENAYHAVLCINGQCVGDNFFKTLRKKNPKALFLYYLWDDIWNLFYPLNTSCFHKVFSYNIDECRKNNWEYLPVFCQRERIGHAENNEYDIAFIGNAHENRIELVNRISDRYGDQFKLFFYLYDPLNKGGAFCHEKPLNYNEYLDVMRKSAVFLDDPYEGQKGPTTRVFDALLTDTKILTTNESIRHYPVYSPNIKIIDRNQIEISAEFVNQPYQMTAYQATTVEKWIDAIGL